MSAVSLMTSLLTEDCSKFLPPQHRTLDHRLFEDVSVAQQDPLMTQTQTLSTWKIGDMAQAVTQIRLGKTPQTPKCQYCQLEKYSLWCTKPVQPVKSRHDLVIPTRTEH